MASVLQELNEAIERGSDKARLRALWHATDLLIAGQYDEDEIWTFGEVIGHLASEIENKARARLSRLLAKSPNAPIKTIDKLALDDAFEVAGPVLRHSERVNVRTLISCAQTKSQRHLLAISKRQAVPEAVTDVLVRRGNEKIVRTAAANPGAQFSESGFFQLLSRAQGDRILAGSLVSRKDIPRHLFQQLIAKAFDETSNRLASVLPGSKDSLKSVVADVAGELHSKFGPSSVEFFSVKRAVSRLHRRGELDEGEIFQFAAAHKFEETMIGLSCLCALPVDMVERALTSKNKEIALVILKSLNFSWDTTTAVLFVGAHSHRMPGTEFENLKATFERLHAETAREILTNYEARRNAPDAKGSTHRLP